MPTPAPLEPHDARNLLGFLERLDHIRAPEVKEFQRVCELLVGIANADMKPNGELKPVAEIIPPTKDTAP